MPVLPAILLAFVLGAASRAETPAAIRDLSARVDYGWFTGDIALIRSALDSLEAAGRDPWTRYLRAYAAYRAGRLALAQGRPAAAELALCISEAEAAAGTAEATAEAGTLIVACAALSASAEPLRAVLHQRRLRQWLTRAESLAPANPRLLLVSRLHLGAEGADAEAVVAAFRQYRSRLDFPAWGEAEALFAQSEARFAAGDLRGARDALEESLLIAPDYRAALELQTRMGERAATR